MNIIFFQTVIFHGMQEFETRILSLFIGPKMYSLAEDTGLPVLQIQL